MTKPTGNPKGRPPSVETRIARALAQEMAKQTTPAVTPTGAMKPSQRIQARYDAGGMGRRLAGWQPKRTSPNTALANLPLIRERQRDSTRNDWASASSVQKWSTTLIGIGITPRFPEVKSKARRKKITADFRKWVRVADADNVLNLYGLQTLAVRTWFDGGECFARRRDRFPDDPRFPGIAPLQVQLLESDMLPLFDSAGAGTIVGLPTNNTIRKGIEFDKRGKRIAYWFHKEHPGEPQVLFSGSADDYVRIPADEVIHLYEPKRPGQIRGVSEGASILARLRNVADYEDATLERQKLANLFVAFVVQKLGVQDFDADEVDPVSGEPLVVAGDGEPLTPLEPGMFQALGEGEDVKFSNPPEAGTNYGEYMRTSHLGTAAGFGLPYEFMSGDIQNISDRALRVIVNEFRRLAEQRQWQIVIPQFCEKIMAWYASSSFLVGTLSEREVDAVAGAEHAPHGWAYIHPVQDVQGKALELENGLRSRSSVIGERGDDPDLVDEEIQADDLRQQELKIGPYGKAAQQAQQKKAIDPQQPAGGEPPDPQPAKKAALELQVLSRLHRQLDMFGGDDE